MINIFNDLFSINSNGKQLFQTKQNFNFQIIQVATKWEYHRLLTEFASRILYSVFKKNIVSKNTLHLIECGFSPGRFNKKVAGGQLRTNINLLYFTPNLHKLYSSQNIYINKTLSCILIFAFGSSQKAFV